MRHVGFLRREFLEFWGAPWIFVKGIDSKGVGWAFVKEIRFYWS